MNHLAPSRPAGCCWSGRDGSRFNPSLLRLRHTGLWIAAQSADKAPFADRLRTRENAALERACGRRQIAADAPGSCPRGRC
ncbi:hypothetical protein BJA5080_01480 [Bradyrhizobium diazoefficiens SEMIA 5080]|uniref:Uncharacterized protein n=1 Tax=Bradyrhizobium diazoefficiens SEMIA 5080 TaxID=754504 RepID=A0A837C738_9BRAD|nr:hypothetical protein BJA5080_01480 [Bradyrhizobium diazoefficiens SEMIA 5080]